jgi:hypothetical protein
MNFYNYNKIIQIIIIKNRYMANCICGKIRSEKCSSKLCGSCCKNIPLPCERHDKAYLAKDNSKNNDDDDDDDDDFYNCKKCGKTYDFYFCDTCKQQFCSRCDDAYRNDKKCQNKGCYYCLRGFCLNNGYYDGIFCEKCFVPRYIECDGCGKKYDEEEYRLDWKCDTCKKIFCEKCNVMNHVYGECHYEDCIYCERGFCRNNALIGSYCSNCYENNNESDSGSDSENNYDSEEESEDEETKKIIYESLEQSISDKNYNAIEKTYNIKFNKIKKFKKRFEKESTKCEICYIRDKECEFDCNHKTCLECFCKSYCLEKNKNCPFCKNHIGKQIMCKCV